MQPDFLDAYDPPANRIGFTGTRLGLTVEQRATLKDFLSHEPAVAFHHGDCVGADADFDDIVRGLHATPVIEIHPATFAEMRAHCERRGPSVMHPPRRFDRRNLEIVRRSETVIVGPDDYRERVRSGTWQTKRMAVRENRRVLVIWPDGRMEDACA